MDLPSHMRHLQSQLPPEIQVHPAISRADGEPTTASHHASSVSQGVNRSPRAACDEHRNMLHGPSGMGELSYKMLDVTREIEHSQDVGLSHSPTFFGPFPGRQASRPSSVTHGGHRSPRDPSFGTPPRSPRHQRTDTSQISAGSLGSGGHHKNQWKPEDISRLEHELKQLRCAAEDLPNWSAGTESAHSQSGSSSFRPQHSPHRMLVSSHDSSSSRAPSPHPSVAQIGHGLHALRNGVIDEEAVMSCSRDCPHQPYEPEDLMLAQTQLREASMEIERLKRALQQAHEEIASMREASKASEAAHSRDVAALASLLQQVTAEKAKVLADAMKWGKNNKAGSTLSTDDSGSVNESEADSLGELGHQIAGPLQR